jgi:very-short-patch-repair endonuclease
MPDALTIHPNMSGQSSTGGVDRLIAALSERQHGVVTRRQLLHAGLAPHVIDHRLELGRLHALHRGVYAIGNRVLTANGRWMAATLAAGPGAALSHRAAGAMWELWRSSYLEVTVTSTRRRPGICIHTSPLPPDEVTSLHAIPVTGVSRTLLDLAAVLPAHQVERAANEAEARGHTDQLSLADLLARYPRRRGIPTIRAILERLQTGTNVTRSELESRFLAFIRKAGLPAPQFNVPLLGFECDCAWHDQRVIAELDGHATHATTTAFERDRARDRALAAAGWRTVRVTWRQLQLDAEALALDFARILGASACR